MSDSQSVASSTAFSLSPYSEKKEFWQQWQQYQDYLYRCCCKWMGGNATDAEDALSRAMLKAWEKAQKYAGRIANFKAWLTKLTYNLCVDIHREHSRGANRFDDIDAIPEEQGLVCVKDTPNCAIENSEKKIVVRRAIDKLPTRLGETFILHFYQELSYQEIAQQQNISYQNVCKRISQARAILQQELREYFIGEDETATELAVIPTLNLTESETENKPEANVPLEAIADETVTLPVAVEEIENIVDKPLIEVLPLVPLQAVIFTSSSDTQLEIHIDSCWQKEEAVYLLLLAPTLAKTQFKNLLTSHELDKLLLHLREKLKAFLQCWLVWMDSGGC